MENTEITKNSIAKNEYQATLFFNRLKKKSRILRKWARQNGISCYRLYNRDIPEIPLSLDIYEFLPKDIKTPAEASVFFTEQNRLLSENDLSVAEKMAARRYAVMYLYERPYEKDEAEEEEWLSVMKDACSNALSIPKEQIITKMRRHQKGLNQYEKIESPTLSFSGLVYEQGQIFYVDLDTYLDTGLFLDHRPLRKKVRERSNGKRVLNLFCYTGSFSVYAASGNAQFVESTDLSNTYLAWAKKNMASNGFSDENKYIYTKADCIRFIESKLKSHRTEDKYDIIILDPPTFSNSKSTNTILDINRDWPKLVGKCTSLLNPNGILYFSTNSTRLSFSEEKIQSRLPLKITDITPFSIHKDFEGKKCHKAWEIERV